MVFQILWVALQLVWVAITLLRVVLGAVLAKMGRGPFRKYANDAKASARFLYMRTSGLVDPKFMAHVDCSMATLLKIVLIFHSEATGSLHGFGKKYDKRSYWIARHPNTRPLILYLHGGAYTRQALPPQFNTMVAILNFLRPEKKKVSVLALDYSLVASGNHQWPRQLHQLHETYQNLIEDGFQDIILFGDSAGGHLAITYLQYLRGFPRLPKPQSLIAISPWVRLSADKSDIVTGSAYHDNLHRDGILFNLFTRKATKEGLIGDNKIDSLTVSPGNCQYNRDDWVPYMPKNVFVSTGEDELFRDDILKWAYYATDCPFWKEQKYGNSNNKYVREKFEYSEKTKDDGLEEVLIEPWGLHDALMVMEGSSALLQWENGAKLSHLDREKYYTFTRVVNFLNETL